MSESNVKERDKDWGEKSREHSGVSQCPSYSHDDFAQNENEKRKL